MQNRKVLVIGNGFDLAHKLPTRYVDFLDFIVQFNFTYEMKKGNPLYGLDRGRYKEFLVLLFRDKREVEDIVNELYIKTHNNIWIAYFSVVMKEKKQNWVDFEKEISIIVSTLEAHFDGYDGSLEKCIEEIRIHAIFKTDLQNMAEKYAYKTVPDFENLVVERYLEHLSDLIRSLEIYFTLYVYSINNLKTVPDIVRLGLKPDDAIISFNYTNTYNRIYKNNQIHKENIHYIHGQAHLTANSDNNMVLGINEIHEGKDIDNKLEYVRFQKYFQRAVKHTDASYKDVFADIGNQQIIEVFIYGHSLDVTDKDILKEIIENQHTVVTIFSYDKETQQQHIANLIKIISKEKFLAFTYSSNPKVKFQLQSNV